MNDQVHMTTDQLKEWQAHMSLTSEDAADMLDIHLNTFLNYRRGYRTMSRGEDTREVPIPKGIAFLCGGILLGLSHYDDLDLEDYPQ